MQITKESLMALAFFYIYACGLQVIYHTKNTTGKIHSWIHCFVNACLDTAFCSWWKKGWILVKRGGILYWKDSSRCKKYLIRVQKIGMHDSNQTRLGLQVKFHRTLSSRSPNFISNHTSSPTLFSEHNDRGKTFSSRLQLP